MRLETYPITARSFEKDYFIDGDAFERAYKNTISGFKKWTEADHAEDWLVFPENIGPYLCIDETCLSTGEVYTIVSNKDAHGKKGCIVAIVKGTKAQSVIKNLKRIELLLRAQVKEVTLDFSESMHSIVEACFPNAMVTLDRFHHQQFCLEAVQEVRIAFRREEMTRVANEREEFRLMLKTFADKGETPTDKEGNPIRLNAAYHPERLENDETRSEILARSKYLLMMSPNKWTDTQKKRASILFREYPEIEKAFSLSHSLRMILPKEVPKTKGKRASKNGTNKLENMVTKHSMTSLLPCMTGRMRF